MGYACNMNTSDFLPFSECGISHLASLNSWSLPRSHVKNMMMMMMIIMMMMIMIIITNN
jgi:hypothetical protein